MNNRTKEFLYILTKMSEDCNEECTDGIYISNFYQTNFSSNILNEFNLGYMYSSSKWELIKRCLRWVWEKFAFNNAYEDTPCYEDLIQLIRKSCLDRISLNCYLRATILTELLHNWNIPARLIYCLPINCSYNGNHVVVEAYVEEFKRWIMVDPSYNIFFSNDKTVLLSLVEFKKLLLNQEHVSINYNNRFTKMKSKLVNKEEYLDMIVPLLGVLQYQMNSDNYQFIRLIPRLYVLPNNVIENEQKNGIMYVYDEKSLYYRY